MEQQFNGTYDEHQQNLAPETIPHLWLPGRKCTADPPGLSHSRTQNGLTRNDTKNSWDFTETLEFKLKRSNALLYSIHLCIKNLTSWTKRPTLLFKIKRPMTLGPGRWALHSLPGLWRPFKVRKRPNGYDSNEKPLGLGDHVFELISIPIKFDYAVPRKLNLLFEAWTSCSNL